MEEEGVMLLLTLVLGVLLKEFTCVALADGVMDGVGLVDAMNWDCSLIQLAMTSAADRAPSCRRMRPMAMVAPFRYVFAPGEMYPPMISPLVGRRMFRARLGMVALTTPSM